jgi:phospholipid/cholesterol/gamma-HCH transport system ATP-binding protein
MTDPLIEVTDLTMGWGNVVLQKNASFVVERGDVFVILGGSGCGKSTMLRYLIGLETPLSGRITVGGVTPEHEDATRPPFGVMFQSGALLGSMTVGENVALPLQQWTQLPREAVWAIAQAKLRLVGLEGTENKLPAEPELMFLDEPSAGLDPVSAFELDELILTLNERLGMTVVIVTHELESIFKIAKNCIMLDKKSKSIIARGSPRELRERSDDPRVHAFFHRTAEAES